MNQTAFSKVLRGTPAATLVLATASLLSLGTMQGQTQTGTTPAPNAGQTSTSGQTTAAPGTVAVTGPGVTALQANAITHYDNRYEIYGGFSYANGQAGQSLPKHYNMGGGLEAILVFPAITWESSRTTGSGRELHPCWRGRRCSG